MRDRETVEMGMRAAMTGHMVFSTLHTINAIATVHRLLDMGAEGFLIASALNAVLAQRLIRRICSNCPAPAELSPQQRVWLEEHAQGTAIDESTVYHAGTGCTYCNMTGYVGRIGIYELLVIDGPLANAIRHGDLTRFAQLAQHQDGFVSLVDQALAFAAEKVTSIEEVIRVTAGLEDKGAGSELLHDLDNETRLRESV
jgi:MSHA biogenesis protein MshE